MGRDAYLIVQYFHNGKWSVHPKHLPDKNFACECDTTSIHVQVYGCECKAEAPFAIQLNRCRADFHKIDEWSKQSELNHWPDDVDVLEVVPSRYDTMDGIIIPSIFHMGILWNYLYHCEIFESYLYTPDSLQICRESQVPIYGTFATAASWMMDTEKNGPMNYKLDQVQILLLIVDHISRDVATVVQDYFKQDYWETRCLIYFI